MCDMLSRGQTLEERLKKEYDPFPADIWSCGIVLFVMLSAEAGFLKSLSGSRIVAGSSFGIIKPSKVAVR